MAKRPSRSQPPTEQERTERRRADRERLSHAAEQLLSREGWMRWVLTRSTLRGYSATNCMLLSVQCHERGIVPRQVHGLHGWRKLGRRVRRGERALRISAPVTVRERDEDGRETGRRRVFFRTASVFELSQTESLPGVESDVAAPREGQPLSGNSHAHLLAPLRAFVESLGYSITFTAIAGASCGWCDTERRLIAVDARAPANAQVRTLIHECVHALGIDYEQRMDLPHAWQYGAMPADWAFCLARECADDLRCVAAPLAMSPRHRIFDQGIGTARVVQIGTDYMVQLKGVGCT